jgi:phage baseplate assembly protein gpV
MTDGLLNIIRRESARVHAQQANTRMGVVTSYDPNQYAAKVLLQPEGIETGFLPVATEWVGNGWGLFCPPTAGDVVDVHFQEWGKNAGYISKRFYSSVTQPLPVQSGEFWLVHKSGSFIKLTNDMKILLNSVGDLDATVGGATNLTSAGDVTMTTPNLIVNGNIIATGDITDQSATTNESMQQMRAKYNSHVHPGIQPGPSDTGLPNPTM